MDGIGLGAEAAGSGATLEVTSEGGDQERAEDELRAPRLGVSWDVLWRVSFIQMDAYLKMGSESQRRKMNLKV